MLLKIRWFNTYQVEFCNAQNVQLRQNKIPSVIFYNTVELYLQQNVIAKIMIINNLKLERSEILKGMVQMSWKMKL